MIIFLTKGLFIITSYSFYDFKKNIYQSVSKNTDSPKSLRLTLTEPNQLFTVLCILVICNKLLNNLKRL